MMNLWLNTVKKKSEKFGIFLVQINNKLTNNKFQRYLITRTDPMKISSVLKQVKVQMHKIFEKKVTKISVNKRNKY